MSGTVAARLGRRQSLILDRAEGSGLTALHRAEKPPGCPPKNTGQALVSAAGARLAKASPAPPCSLAEDLLQGCSDYGRTGRGRTGGRSSGGDHIDQGREKARAAVAANGCPGL
jgi:hypothetical protein